MASGAIRDDESNRFFTPMAAVGAFPTGPYDVMLLGLPMALPPPISVSCCRWRPGGDTGKRFC